MDDRKLKSTLCKGFALWKYSFQNHPMQNERKKYREIYYQLLERIVIQMVGEHPVYIKLFQKLRERLELLDTKDASASEDKLCQDFSGKIFWHGGLKFGWRDHRMLLIMEACLLSWALIDKVDMQKLESYARMLCIDDNEIAIMRKHIPQIFIDEVEMGNVISDNSSISLKRSLLYLKEQWRSEYKRSRTPRFRVAVCGTMSSGKSTLLNAMLGSNPIPYGNMACTAKIISIENDHEQDSLIGCKLSSDSLPVYAEVTDEILDAWNIDKDTTHIYLSGSLEGIKSEKRILQLYDTPGTNASQKVSHGELTKKFLKETPLDLILYICNAEQAGTTDEADFLTWMKENIVKRKNTDILFVVNKMDSLNSAIENALEFIHKIYENLCDIGFNNPIIVPISANAAWLFRMAQRKEELSMVDKLYLKKYYCYFVELKRDFRKLSEGLCLMPNKQYMKEYLEFDEEKLSKQELLEAIERTGILALERMLKDKIEGEV